jgi:hypothetical protein
MATNQRDKQYGNAGGAAAVADTAREGAAKAGDMIREGAGKAGDMLQTAASAVGKKADEATAAVGSGMESLAGTIRDKAPHSGPLGTAGSAMADTLETSGRYLHEHGLSGIADDVTTTIRRHPVPAVLIAIGIGFLLARASGR